jgi:hypothetical protein
MINLLPATLRFLVGSLLWFNFSQPPAIVPAPRPSPLSFHLRHQHAITNDSRVIFSDMAPSFAADSYDVNALNIQTHRPQSATAFHSARLRSIRYDQSERVLWNPTDVLGPNVEDRETLLTLAKMTSNAYTTPSLADWYVLDGWNRVCLSTFIQLYILLMNDIYSPRHSAGNPTQTDSEGIFSSRMTTPQWCFRSKVLLLAGLQAVGVQPYARIS